MISTLKNCFQKPTKFCGFGNSITHVLAVDENGSTSNLDYVKKQIALSKPIDKSRNFFTVTGCLYTRSEYDTNLFLLSQLKKQYWREDANKVLFHSHDVRKREGFFFMSPKKSEQFMESLSRTMELIQCQIMSITFDMTQYVLKEYHYDPYTVAFDFLLSQVINLIPPRSKVCIILESRGQF